MTILLNIGLIILSAVILWIGALWVVDSASAVARKFRLSEMTIGLTIVAMGTSLPEFLVTATASFKGLGDISLSNIVGSNIFNLGIILGMLALIRPIPAHRTLIRRDVPLLLCLGLFILIMLYDLQLGRSAGFMLLIFFVSYNLFVFLRSPALPKGIPSVESRKAGKKDYIRLLTGFVLVAAGGHLMVDNASSLAEMAGISQWAVGVTIVAAGTSLPELFTCLAALWKGKHELLLGNLIGSDIFNFAGVLGLTCILNPISISQAALPGMFTFLIMVAILLLFMRTGFRITRVEGAVLICISLARWGVDLQLLP